jgi:hypothetical protein
MPLRLLAAFMVLALPLTTVILVRNVPFIVLPKALTIDMRVGCFVRDLKKPAGPDEITQRTWIEKTCQDARPAAKQPGSAPQGTTSPADQGAAKATERDGAPAQLAKSAPGKQQAANAPAEAGARATRVETLAQFRAAEARTRTNYGVASGLLHAIAFGAVFFALSQLVQNWRGRAAEVAATNEQAFKTSRRVLILTSPGVLGFAAWIAYCDATTHDFDNVLIGSIIAAGENAGTLRAGTGDTYTQLMTINLTATYIAASLLLIYLATLALPFGAPTTMKERLAGFQFVIVIGAAVLAVTVYALQKAVDLAMLAIDPSTGESLIEAVRTLLDLWSTICIVFLFTAIVAGYFAIRASGASASEPGADSALALSTPSGDDLKTLGWIVQLTFALAPAWLPPALKTIFEQVGGAPF